MERMNELLMGLRAAAEPTRLRLLVLCAQGEFTVSELTDILGQSQPRVSRHLKLLCDAGLLDRFREGTWVFYRAARRARAGELARLLIELGPQVERAVGVDLSREMLAVARVNLERANLRNCSLRQADMYQLPLPGASFDAVVIHQVLHYAERPAQAIAEAARVLRPQGRLVIVDFAPHDLEFLRTEHAHRRLGFADDEVLAWCRATGLEPEAVQRLPGNPLTVSLWPARRGAQADDETGAPALAEASCCGRRATRSSPPSRSALACARRWSPSSFSRRRRLRWRKGCGRR